MKESERTKHLWALAEKDEIYLFWKNCFETSETPFKEFADNCPPEIQEILYGYADCGKMMCQRVVNIACKYMDFMDQDKK